MVPLLPLGLPAEDRTCFVLIIEAYSFTKLIGIIVDFQSVF